MSTDPRAVSDAGKLAVELITLWVNDERDEAERRVSRALLGDENVNTVRELILVMVEALAHTWGNDPERWRQQLLDVALHRCPECGHDLTADNDHADWCKGRFGGDR